jgi:hypothetical protein
MQLFYDPDYDTVVVNFSQEMENSLWLNTNLLRRVLLADMLLEMWW